MTAKTHDLIAFTSLVTIASYCAPQGLNLMTIISSVLGADFGALIPDIDTAGNRIWDMLPAGNLLGRIFKKTFYKHRTITHSFLGMFIFYSFFNWILPKMLNQGFINPRILTISIMIGYISHLFADGFTEEGLPLFFPLKFKFGFPPISSWRIKTGGWFEKIIVTPAVAVYLLWFVANNQDKIKIIFKTISG